MKTIFDFIKDAEEKGYISSEYKKGSFGIECIMNVYGEKKIIDYIFNILCEEFDKNIGFKKSDTFIQIHLFDKYLEIAEHATQNNEIGYGCAITFDKIKIRRWFNDRAKNKFKVVINDKQIIEIRNLKKIGEKEKEIEAFIKEWEENNY